MQWTVNRAHRILVCASTMGWMQRRKWVEHIPSEQTKLLFRLSWIPNESSQLLQSFCDWHCAVHSLHACIVHRKYQEPHSTAPTSLSSFYQRKYFSFPIFIQSCSHTAYTRQYRCTAMHQHFKWKKFVFVYVLESSLCRSKKLNTNGGIVDSFRFRNALSTRTQFEELVLFID